MSWHLDGMDGGAHMVQKSADNQQRRTRWLLNLVVVVPAVIFVWMTWSAYRSYQALQGLVTRDFRVAELRGSIAHLDEVLTMSANMAALTGEARWEARYRSFEPALDAAIKEAVRLVPEGAASISQTDEANLRLVELENRAFELVRQGKASEARAVLEGAGYQTQKKIYADGLAHFSEELKVALQATIAAQEHASTWNIVLVIASISILSVFWIAMLRSERGWQQAVIESNLKLSQQAADLQRTNELLSQEIQERKRAAGQLTAMQRELMAISRRAGMAEVATGVLHNVGNVLNSVNVTANLVADKIRQSKSASVERVADLLRQNENNLGAFFTADERGKQLPSYVSKLAECLSEDRELLMHELESLNKNIDHIKDIVNMQQSYAQVYGVVEDVKLSELVEDSLRMNAAALARHDVQVIRDFGEDVSVTVDKHHVLQILVNLIRNAKYACDEGARLDKHLTIRIGQTETGMARVQVSDDGVGIPAENLTRIFSHGFTTRNGGHGFGLHSSALVAKEMGGSLAAHSDGQGKGACFTLEFPVKHARVEEVEPCTAK